MNTRVRRVVAAGVLVGGALVVAAGGSAQAHPCAQVRVHLGGSTTAVGSCHLAPCPADHAGFGADPTFGGTGVGTTVCA